MIISVILAADYIHKQVLPRDTKGGTKVSCPYPLKCPAHANDLLSSFQPIVPRAILNKNLLNYLIIKAEFKKNFKKNL